MEANEISMIVDSMSEDELGILSQLLSLSDPEHSDAMILRESGRPFCDACGCAMSKNGTDGNGHQKWICGGCGKTLSSTTSRPTARTRLNARKRPSFVKCGLAGVPLRLSSAYCRVSLKAAFMLRRKLQCAISSVVSAISLVGRVELGAKFIRANFKGTKPRDMPRASKKRGHGSAGHVHKVCVIFAIGEFDSFVGLVAGIGGETREKADAMLPFLAGRETLVTDERSCYEAFARDNGFRHVQIKGIAGRSDEDGEAMNEVNGLTSEFETRFARFRGVSSKHLQGYVDRFLFQKALSYAKEALDRPGTELSRPLKTKSVILCREILSKAMPFDVKEAYGKWHCGIFGGK